MNLVLVQSQTDENTAIRDLLSPYKLRVVPNVAAVYALAAQTDLIILDMPGSVCTGY
jgi:hypothetical protein